MGTGGEFKISVCVSAAAVTKHHRLRLKEQTLTVSSPEAGIPDPGVGRAGPPEASLLRVDGHLRPVSSQGCPSVYVCVLISSFKDTSPMGLGPTLVTTFYLHQRPPSPNTATSLGPGGQGPQHINLGRHSSAHPVSSSLTLSSNMAVGLNTLDFPALQFPVTLSHYPTKSSNSLP